MNYSHAMQSLCRRHIFDGSQILRVEEIKPPIVNTQSVAYLCEGNLCDANYVGYAIQHAPTSTRQ